MKKGIQEARYRRQDEEPMTNESLEWSSREARLRVQHHQHEQHSESIHARTALNLIDEWPRDGKATRGGWALQLSSPTPEARPSNWPVGHVIRHRGRHRTHTQSSLLFPFELIFCLSSAWLVLAAYPCSHSLVAGQQTLESPVKIQMKLQQQQLASGGPRAPPPNQTASEPVRMRRTNYGRAEQQAAGGCPSQRLMLSLLEPQWQRASARERPQCECLSEWPLGWTVSCYAASSAQLGPATGGSVQQRASLPDQLHPAFVGPQLQRRQQQQQLASQSPPAHRSRLRTRSLASGQNELAADDKAESAGESVLHSGDSQSGFDDEGGAHQNEHSNEMSSAESSLGANFSRRDSSGHESLHEATSARPANPKREAADQQQAAGSARSSGAQSANLQSSSFHSIPVLFSLRYNRNKMIEIDCDQGAPNYKPALFQGKSFYKQEFRFTFIFCPAVCWICNGLSIRHCVAPCVTSPVEPLMQEHADRREMQIPHRLSLATTQEPN